MERDYYDGIGITLVIVVLMIMSALVGALFGQAHIKSEAITAKVAIYTADSTGRTNFEWKCK